MKQFIVIVYLLRLLQSTVCIDYDGWLNIKMEHSINCGSEKFCHRGTISLKSIRAGTSSIDQINLNKHHIQALEELAEVDGFYSVKTIVTTADNKESEFLSSIKAQAFLDNGLSDIINTWILPNGAVMAVTFQAKNTTHPMVLGVNNGYKIHSNFYLRYVDQAPVPDTASYIQKLEREREAREKGELKDNRSFLAKYWMYIVPIAIFVMISGATNPEAAGPAAR